ncbi:MULTISPECIES: ExbD/TolR family protein [Pseudomonas]|uniref:Biopolymer transporter ExbD n=1 Tax=Pseudomonas kuykendallii TaxID=1007099 RepID=A0A2W5CXF1_9PSED|nr:MULTISPECIES: biopolymer transporter ExbD [Pseudomonas]PZP22883.1 MAG: biopolymer transporter ExbD [Pseudomonas kuykendallii]
MKFRRRRVRENIELNMVSLIDIVFVLLLFFVVTTTFTRETNLKVDLPEAVSGEQTTPSELKQLEILIDATGSYALNGQALLKNDLDGLMTALQKESAGDNSLPLTISADGKTPHQAVITAMDAAGKLGFSHLRLTTVEATAKP